MTTTPTTPPTGAEAEDLVNRLQEIYGALHVLRHALEHTEDPDNNNFDRTAASVMLKGVEGRLGGILYYEQSPAYNWMWSCGTHEGAPSDQTGGASK